MKTPPTQIREGGAGTRCAFGFDLHCVFEELGEVFLGQLDRVSAAGRVDEGAFDELGDGVFGDAELGQSAGDAE